MATTAQRFFCTLGENTPITMTGEVDIRAAADQAQPNQTTTIATVPQTGSGEITLDPYTTRSTTGSANADDMGWMVNKSQGGVAAHPGMWAPFPDYSGNIQSGDRAGEPDIITAPTSGYGQAIDMDGVDNDARSDGVISISTLPLAATTAFTIEGRWRKDANPASGQHFFGAVLDWTSVTTDRDGFILGLNSSGQATCQVWINNAFAVNIAGTTALTNGVMYDLAADWDGSDVRLYVNGAVEATAAWATGFAGATAQHASVGRSGSHDSGTANSPFALNGLCEEFRLSSVARYAGAYTPITVPFGSDANTAILWHFDTITAKRVIAAGTWTFQARLTTSTAANLRTIGFKVRVYRVSADGATRTLLFTSDDSTGAVITPATPSTQTTTAPDQAEVVLEDGESILFAPAINYGGTSNVVGTTAVTYATNDTAVAYFETPSPGVRTRYAESISGSVGPAGALTRTPTRNLTASTTPAGALVRVPTRNLVASTTPTGALARTPTRNLASSTTPAGALARTPTRNLTGTITPGPGTLVRTPTRGVTGTITPVGALVRNVTRNLTGTITPVGHPYKTPILDRFAGTISPAGSLFRTPVKALTASITPGPSTLTRTPTRGLTGTITPTGALTRDATRNLAGSIALTGALIRTATRNFAGSISSSGEVIRTPVRNFSGTITPGPGNLSTLITKNFTGTITPVGTLAKLASRTFNGLVTPVGILTKTPTINLEGSFCSDGGVIVTEEFVYIINE